MTDEQIEKLARQCGYRPSDEIGIYAFARALLSASKPAAHQDSRYIVIGYSESDYPQASFANDQDELLDAVLGMIYTRPSNACYDTREEYRRDLADEDEWCGKVWRTEFEIGGIVVYDTGASAAPAAPAQSWRIVPSEPTQEMLKAVTGENAGGFALAYAAYNYRAMLAASPSAP